MFGVWHITIAIVLSLAAASLIWKQPLPRVARALWVYVLVYAIYILEFPARHFGDFTIAYQVTAGQVAVEALLIPLGAMALYKFWHKILPIVVIGELICVWIKHPGLMVAPSFNLALCAVSLPFLPLWMVVSVAVTALTHHGSTAILILIAQSIGMSRRYPRLLLLIPFCGLAAWIHSNGPMIDGLERLEHWNKYMSFWWGSGWKTILLGFGPGSFIHTSMWLDKYKAPLFFQMHNDFLQSIWELGIVGFSLIIGVVATAIKRTWDRPKELAAVLGCVAFAIPYHPLRFCPSALVMAVIFWKALKKEGL
jgi:hypothetical protein